MDEAKDNGTNIICNTIEKTTFKKRGFIFKKIFNKTNSRNTGKCNFTIILFIINGE